MTHGNPQLISIVKSQHTGGNVTVFKTNGQRIVLSSERSVDLAPGDWIATGKDSRLKLHYAFENGGEDMILGSSSVLNIVTNESGTHEPKLLRGDMYVVSDNVQEKIADIVLDTKAELTNYVYQFMAPLKRLSSKMNVRTPHAAMSIQGTEFTIQVDEFDNTEVNVKNGIVDLTGNLMNGTITLAAGTKGIVKATGEILGPLEMDEKQFDNGDNSWQ